jgi:hypothetical protein
MKIAYLILSLAVSTSLFAKEALIICPMYYYSSVKTTVEANGQYDKYKHCAVSCMLTLRCPAIDVLELGILKELADTVGPGNAEIADLKADYYGVALVSNRKVKTDKACMLQCHLKYPENSCRNQ